MRIVIDTNIIASAVFFGGNPRKIIEALFEKKLEAFITPEILEEYHETFFYAKYLHNWTDGLKRLVL